MSSETNECDLVVGQKVRVFSHRWTFDGWEPVVDLATVVDPCVKDDPVYAGDVKLAIEGVFIPVFALRSTIEPVIEVAAPKPHVLTPGAYLKMRRCAALLSVADVAARLATAPRLAEHARAELIELIEADAAPAGFSTLVAFSNVYAFDFDVLASLERIKCGADILPPQICRICACTSHDPCVTGPGHICVSTCSWAEYDLCSSCATPAQAAA